MAQKNPRAQNFYSQFIFFKCGNSSNHRRSVLPFIRSMILLGVIVDGALTKIFTRFLITIPFIILILKIARTYLTIFRARSAPTGWKPVDLIL